MWAFLRDLRRMPVGWQVWVALLVLVNGILPWLFWERLEARVALAVFLVGAGGMMLLHRRYGFVRLLGAAHFLWLLLLPWLWLRLEERPQEIPVRAWILAVLVLDGISLVIDVADVVRYWRGERRPTV